MGEQTGSGARYEDRHGAERLNIEAAGGSSEAWPPADEGAGNRRVSPGELLALCRPELLRITGGAEPEDWLRYTRELLLRTFFPGSAAADAHEGRPRAEQMQEAGAAGAAVPQSAKETQDEAAFSKAACFFLQELNRAFAVERERCSFDPFLDFALPEGEELAGSACAEEFERFRHLLGEEGLYAFMRLSRECTSFNTLGHIAGVHHIALHLGRQLAARGEHVDLALLSGAAVLHDVGKFGCRSFEARRVPYLHYYYTYRFTERFGLPAIGSVAANHSVWDLELDRLPVENLLLIYADFRVKSRRTAEDREELHIFSLAESYEIILGKLDEVDEEKRRRYARAYARLRDFEDYMRALGCSPEPEQFLTEPSIPQASSVLPAEELVRLFRFKSVSSTLRVMQDITCEERFLGLLEAVRSEKDDRHVGAFMTVVGEYSSYLSQRQKTVILRFFFEMLSHPSAAVRRRAAKLSARLIAGYELRFTKWLPEGAEPPRIGRSLREIWTEFLDYVLRPEAGLSVRQRQLTGQGLSQVVRELAALLSARTEDLRTVEEVLLSRLTPGHDLLTRQSLLAACSGLFYKMQPATAAERLRSLAESLLLPPEAASPKPRTRDDSEPSGFGNGWGDGPEEVDLEAEEERYGDPATLGLKEDHRLKKRMAADETGAEQFLRLDAAERRQVLAQLRSGVESRSGRLCASALWSTGLILRSLLTGEREDLTEEVRAAEGLLCLGLVHYRPEISAEAFYVLGRTVFRDGAVPLSAKRTLFSDIARKLTSVHSREEEGFLSYYRAAAYKYIHAFLTDCSLTAEPVPAAPISRPLFFPGTFDPFSLGHREAVRALAERGYTVFAAIDDFFWSKKSRPVRVRQQILELETADLPGVYLFPSACPVNLANPADLRRLAEVFGGRRPVIAVGTEVVRHASAYRKTPEEWSVHSFPHILLEREGEGETWPEDVCGRLCAEVRVVRLPASCEQASADRIRRHISEGQDLSELLTAAAEHYILEIGCYTMEPVFKKSAGLRAVEAELFLNGKPLPYTCGAVSAGCGGKMVGQSSATVAQPMPEQCKAGMARPVPEESASGGAQQVPEECAAAVEQPVPYESRSGDSVLSAQQLAGAGPLEIRLTQPGDGGCIGRVRFRLIGTEDLYAAAGDAERAGRLRQQLAGVIAVISELDGVSGPAGDGRQSVLNELLAWCQAGGCSYALHIGETAGAETELLQRAGFRLAERESAVYVCDLRHPVVLFFDTPASVKELFAGGERLRNTLWDCHLRLVRAMTALYPGMLVLSFDSDMLNYRLLQLIRRYNPPVEEPGAVRALGRAMCVPFGKVLRGSLVPDCVTKPLDSEKIYASDLAGFRISEFPGYLPLREQLRAIRSFGRPVILTDDLYHKSYRLREIDRLAEQEGITFELLAVGVLSGRGRDLAEEAGRQVRSVYFVPHMRSWFIESDLYPFIGGDGVETAREGLNFSLPSINPILPCVAPSFMKGASAAGFYRLSEVCLENAAAIWRVLEEEYRHRFGRKLTLARIGEVMAEPRHPDSAGPDGAHPETAPSELVREELMRLRRMKHLTDGSLV